MKQIGLSKKLSYRIVVLLSVVTYLLMEFLIVPLGRFIYHLASIASDFVIGASVVLSIMTLLAFYILMSMHFPIAISQVKKSKDNNL